MPATRLPALSCFCHIHTQSIEPTSLCFCSALRDQYLINISNLPTPVATNPLYLRPIIRDLSYPYLQARQPTPPAPEDLTATAIIFASATLTFASSKHDHQHTASMRRTSSISSLSSTASSETDVATMQIFVKNVQGNSKFQIAHFQALQSSHARIRGQALRSRRCPSTQLHARANACSQPQHLQQLEKTPVRKLTRAQQFLSPFLPRPPFPPFNT